MSQTPEILVAMSGGVDSSTAAALLVEEGFRVSGLYMDMHLSHKIRHDAEGHEISDQHDAQAIADQLGIPLHVIDFRDAIDQVIGYFIEEYRRGRTPNPCIMCNRKLKFGRILDFADSIGARWIATGHYAQIIEETGQFKLCRAANRSKDQSYALFGMGYKKLSRVRFPLGAFSKDLIRQLAQEKHLPVYDKDDSQEICFVPDDDYVRFIEKQAPDLKKPGPIVNTNGEVLGEHEGVYRYTIGQRRGLGIALGVPAYVVDINAETRTVTLGTNDDLQRQSLTAENVCWTVPEPPTAPFQAIVQIRYNHRGAPARVIPVLDRPNGVYQVRVEFDNPVRAVTPGQAAVFYCDNQIIGGGWIIG